MWGVRQFFAPRAHIPCRFYSSPWKPRVEVENPWLKDPRRKQVRPTPTRWARETSLATVDDDEKKLPWENEADTDEVPIEQRALYREIDLQRQLAEEQAREIMKMPDYQHYTRVLHDRINFVEMTMAEKKKPFNAAYTQEVDKMIEEVIYSTQESFHAYYKRRDERIFARIEERLEKLKNLSDDPELIKFLLEIHEKDWALEKEELALLEQNTRENLGFIPDDEVDEVVDDDDILSEEEEADPLLVEYPELKEDPLYIMASYKKPLDPKPKKFEYKGADKNYDPLKGNVYKGYEDIQLYKKEREDSYQKGYDIIDAHFINRERKRLHKERYEAEQRFNSNETMTAFFDVLSKHKEAQMAFQHSVDARKKDFNFEELQPPTAEQLDKLEYPKEQGISGEMLEAKRALEYFSKLPKETKRR